MPASHCPPCGGRRLRATQRTGLDLEIKPTPGTEVHTGAAVAAAVERLWHGHSLVPLLSSFQPEALRAARDTVSELPRALLLDSLPPDAIDGALGLGCIALITEHKLMDAALVARIHAADMRDGLHRQ